MGMARIFYHKWALALHASTAPIDAHPAAVPVNTCLPTAGPALLCWTSAPLLSASTWKEACSRRLRTRASHCSPSHTDHHCGQFSPQPDPSNLAPGQLHALTLHVQSHPCSFPLPPYLLSLSLSLSLPPLSPSPSPSPSSLTLPLLSPSLPLPLPLSLPLSPSLSLSPSLPLSLSLSLPPSLPPSLPLSLSLSLSPGVSTRTCYSLMVRVAGSLRSLTCRLDSAFMRRSSVWRGSWQASQRCSTASPSSALCLERPPSIYPDCAPSPAPLAPD